MICNSMISHWPDNAIGNSMDPADWLDFVGTPRGRSSPQTAAPNAGTTTFVMSGNLCGMCTYIFSHLINSNGYMFAKFIRRGDIFCVSNGTFIYPEDHVFQSCLSYIQPVRILILELWLTVWFNLKIRIFLDWEIDVQTIIPRYGSLSEVLRLAAYRLNHHNGSMISPGLGHAFVRHHPYWRLVPRYQVFFLWSILHESVSNDNLFPHGHRSPGWSIDFHS